MFDRNRWGDQVRDFHLDLSRTVLLSITTTFQARLRARGFLVDGECILDLFPRKNGRG